MGSKRKLEESEDREHDENLRNIPNTETQELYNTMRALEEANTNGIALDHHVQIQSRGGANEYSGHLRLPSPSLAPTSPRSPASTTQSVTGALENVGIHDEEPQPSKKRRAVRHGSLDPVKRAKAALMRKLGVCRDCKSRKVKCDHFNRDLFEAGYQATKHRQHSMPSRPFSFEATATTPVTPISQSSDHAFTGLGDWQNTQAHVPPGTQYEDQPGQEILLDPPAPSRSPAGNGNFFPSIDLNIPYPIGFPQRLRTAPSVTFIPRDSSAPIPIGRLTLRGWECKHGSEDELSLLNPCTYRCDSISELLTHFDTHHDSEVTTHFMMWKCIQPTQTDPSQVCAYLSIQRSSPCDSCRSTRNAWENWCYGTITHTPSLVSGSSSYYRVPSGDGSTNWTHPNQPFFGTSYGQYDNQKLFPGRQVGGGGQTRSHHSYSAAAKSVNCFRGVGVGSVYPRGCPYGGSRCLKRRSTDLGAKASVSLLVMMLTMLSLGLMPTLSAEAKTKQSLAAMLEAAKEHVSCMSLACVAAGLVGMWLFKHVKFRLGQDPGDSCHQRCLATDLLGVESKFDVEDAGSMRGEEMAEVNREMRGVLA